MFGIGHRTVLGALLVAFLLAGVLGAAMAGATEPQPASGAASRPSTQPEIKKIAAVCTIYDLRYHADSIVTKFLAGFPTDEGVLPPKVKIVSMYLDQSRPDDLGHKVAEHYGIPIYPTIEQAMTLDGNSLAVDGVLFVGEHGKYPRNQYGETMYPRMRIAAEIFRVFEVYRKVVPVFLDKHLAYNWIDAKWVYDRSKELGVPLMAGSSIPLIWRNPPLEHPRDCNVAEAVFLTYADPDSYGMHAIEAIECMIERRKGGETGVASVQCVRGKDFYQAADEGQIPMDLVETAAATIAEKKPGKMVDHARDPIGILVKYRDGTRATVVMCRDYYGFGWAYSARVDGKVVATQFVYPPIPTKPSFSYLGLNIQELFLTGRPQFPLERTLLSSGVVDAACRSLTAGGTIIDTPQLDIRYRSDDFHPIRATATQPSGATTQPWPPEDIRIHWQPPKPTPKPAAKPASKPATATRS